MLIFETSFHKYTEEEHCVPPLLSVCTANLNEILVGQSTLKLSYSLESWQMWETNSAEKVSSLRLSWNEKAGLPVCTLKKSEVKPHPQIRTWAKLLRGFVLHQHNRCSAFGQVCCKQLHNAFLLGDKSLKTWPFPKQLVTQCPSVSAPAIQLCALTCCSLTRGNGV